MAQAKPNGWVVIGMESDWVAQVPERQVNERMDLQASYRNLLMCGVIEEGQQSDEISEVGDRFSSVMDHGCDVGFFVVACTREMRC